MKICSVVLHCLLASISLAFSWFLKFNWKAQSYLEKSINRHHAIRLYHQFHSDFSMKCVRFTDFHRDLMKNCLHFVCALQLMLLYWYQNMCSEQKMANIWRNLHLARSGAIRVCRMTIERTTVRFRANAKGMPGQESATVSYALFDIPTRSRRPIRLSSVYLLNMLFISNSIDQFMHQYYTEHRQFAQCDKSIRFNYSIKYFPNEHCKRNFCYAN